MLRIAPRKKPTVLLVDDDASFRTIVQEVLQETADCRVIEAENGARALEVLQTVTPDLILVDLVMPVMNGWDFVAALAKDPRLATIRVAVLSGWEPGEVVDDVRVLHKPMDLPNVVGLLDVVEDARLH